VYDTPVSGQQSAFATYANHVHLEYEAPDFPVHYGAAPWRAQPEMRIIRLDVASHRFTNTGARESIRRYRMTYWPQAWHFTFPPAPQPLYDPLLHAPMRQKSFLKTIQMEGACGVKEIPGAEGTDTLPAPAQCELMPPAKFKFTAEGSGAGGGTFREIEEPKNSMAGDPDFHEPLDPYCTATGNTCLLPNIGRSAFIDIDRDGFPERYGARTSFTQ
jgi:hypothetical protein